MIRKRQCKCLLLRNRALLICTTVRNRTCTGNSGVRSEPIHIFEGYNSSGHRTTLAFLDPEVLTTRIWHTPKALGDPTPPSCAAERPRTTPPGRAAGAAAEDDAARHVHERPSQARRDVDDGGDLAAESVLKRDLHTYHLGLGFD